MTGREITTRKAADLASQIDELVDELVERNEIVMALACAGQRSCSDDSPIERGVFMAQQGLLTSTDEFKKLKQWASEFYDLVAGVPHG